MTLRKPSEDKPTGNTNMSFLLPILTLSLVISGCSGQGCNDGAEVMCMETMLRVFQNMSNNLVTGNINLITLINACPDYRQYQQCVSPECLYPLFQDVHVQIVAAFTFICDVAASNIQSKSSCWNNPGLVTDLIDCASYAKDVAISNAAPCLLYEELEFCIEDATHFRCSRDAADLMRGFLAVVNVPQKYDLQCPERSPIAPVKRPVVLEGPEDKEPMAPKEDQTTPPEVAVGSNGKKPELLATPETPVRCFDCNSGGSGHVNYLCPVNGDLRVDLLTSVTCSEPCFVRIDPNSKVIYRGCSKGYYFPTDVEKRGCVENPDGGVVWCFCSSDKCNTQDMTSFLAGIQ